VDQNFVDRHADLVKVGGKGYFYLKGGTIMKRCQVRLLVGFLAVWVLGAAQTVRADFVHLTLQSQPGDFIGQGKNFDLTYDTAQGDTISPQIRRRLPDGSPAELLWVLNKPGPDNTFALLFFGTDALGIPIQPGNYPNARRADFAPPGFAGLDVSFQNRGSNQVFGSFTITDVTFSADLTKILTFDATFEQHSENPNAPALFGHFQFNEPIAAVPEPSSLVLLGLGAVAVVGLARRGRRQVAATGHQ
jgi:hypothetical protein